ncbi:MAG: ATP-binding cassette domain-containing protein [Bacteroidales bacterium]|nr:ATP-binding cassette domain-containing protein [Bacteroidales bacterium]
MSIEIQSLTRSFGEQKAVNELSFSVNKGEVVGFLGPNGSGKSTTMRCVCGILPYDQGVITVEGLDVQKNPLDIKRMIGYLPEHNPLPLDMYIKEYLKYVDGFYSKAQGRNERVEQIIEHTGLKLEQHKRIGQLSKGYRQRVGLAQAMIHDPEVLILDEPTTGLDPNQIIEIRNLISGIAKNKTVILSTHILQEVEAICDRVVVLNKGILVADGTTADLTWNSKRREQSVFVEFRDEVDPGLLEKMGQIGKIRTVNQHSYVLEGTAEKDLRESLFLFAIKHKLVILGLQKKSDNLEEAFRALTQQN